MLKRLRSNMHRLISSTLIVFSIRFLLGNLQFDPRHCAMNVRPPTGIGDAGRVARVPPDDLLHERAATPVLCPPLRRLPSRVVQIHLPIDTRNIHDLVALSHGDDDLNIARDVLEPQFRVVPLKRRERLVKNDERVLTRGSWAR